MDRQPWIAIGMNQSSEQVQAVASALQRMIGCSSVKAAGLLDLISAVVHKASGLGEEVAEDTEVGVVSALLDFLAGHETKSRRLQAVAVGGAHSLVAELVALFAYSLKSAKTLSQPVPSEADRVAMSWSGIFLEVVGHQRYWRRQHLFDAWGQDHN